jgi:putative transposase
MDMPRKLLHRNDILPYHVTARANNREDFPLPLQALWEICGEECLLLNWFYEVEFQAFVLMPNHFHVIMTVPAEDLGIVMNQLMKSISRRINQKSGRNGHVFGGPYYWSLIRNSRYYGHAVKYVYRNPVRASLCARAEDYPFSTLRGLLGETPLPFPIHFTRVGAELSLPTTENDTQLSWINTPFSTEAQSLIQKGLRKKVFDKIVDRKTRKSVDLLNNLI